MENVSANEQVQTEGVQNEGVQASDTGQPQSQPQNTNDWETMARNAQAGHDRYTNLESKYGTNFESKLDFASEFERQWENNPSNTIENLQKQAGIKVNESKPQTQAPAGDLNVWELDKEGSTANQWLENKISTEAKQQAQAMVNEALTKDKRERQVANWRQQLNSKGITDINQQDIKIREFLNPNPDFGQFLEGSVSPNQVLRPSEVLKQVSHSDSQPQTTGVLKGGMPPQKSADDADVDEVMKYVKQNMNQEF